MQSRVKDLDDLRRIEIPAGQSAAARLEDRQHAPIALKRRHVRIELRPFEFRETVEFLDQKTRAAHVFVFMVPVEACKNDVLPKRYRLRGHAILVILGKAP